MFDHAVAAIDFSPATDQMLHYLPQLSRLGVKGLTLLHIFDISYPRAPEPGHMGHYRRRLEELQNKLTSHELSVVAELRTGRTSTEILQCAGEHDGALIVIGSHGHTAVGEHLLGSVAGEVTHKSPYPLLILPIHPRVKQDEEDRHKTEAPNAGGDITRHVLFSTDFSPVSRRAAHLVERLPEYGTRKFTLLSVHRGEGNSSDKQDNGDGDMHAKQVELEGLASRLTAGRPNVSVQIMLPKGKPEPEIVNTIDRVEPSLVIMGSQGHGVLSSLFIGSVSSYVIHHAPLPVLLIPAER